jgi:PemK-like, MazF-like toxin of type II toxin-antitoxin system
MLSELFMRVLKQTRRRLLGRAGRPGEIWWADVPYEDGTGSKVRPCLILKPRWNGYDVLKITSQDQSRRHDYIRIPTRHWDRNAEKDSYLDLSDPIRVRVLDNKAGVLDSPTWRKVRKLHGI